MKPSTVKLRECHDKVHVCYRNHNVPADAERYREIREAWQAWAPPTVELMLVRR